MWYIGVYPHLPALPPPPPQQAPPHPYPRPLPPQPNAPHLVAPAYPVKLHRLLHRAPASPFGLVLESELELIAKKPSLVPRPILRR
jgi:hypothetical protein